MDRVSPAATTVRVSYLGGEVELVAGLRASNPAAQRAFFGRYAAYIERVLRSVLGPDAELSDAVQDVFVAAFRQVNSLRAPEALTEWLRIIAVGVANNRIRSRTRHRWLAFLAPEHLPERALAAPAVEATEALHAMYAALDELPAPERLAFALRYVEDMTVPELATALRTSESTVKRRLRTAERLFDEASARHPALAEWLAREATWRVRR